MSDYLQYGAMGLLALAMAGIYQLLRMFLTSFLASFHDLVATVKEIVPALHEMKNANDAIVSELRNKPCIAEYSKGRT